MNRAEKLLKKAIELDPRFSDAYVRLAQVYKIKGSQTQYEDFLRKALSLDPRSELALDIKSGDYRFICPR